MATISASAPVTRSSGDPDRALWQIAIKLDQRPVMGHLARRISRIRSIVRRQDEAPANAMSGKLPAIIAGDEVDIARDGPAPIVEIVQTMSGGQHPMGRHQGAGAIPADPAIDPAQ